MANKYYSRMTRSARGEAFNPLIWPFFISTLAYGVGFLVFLPLTSVVGDSSLFRAMTAVGEYIPVAWGAVAVLTILCGLTFLMFNIPPFGKVSGLVGFGIWVFASICYMFAGGWLPLFSVAIPNIIFWFWQYLSLSRFRDEDEEDKKTMEHFSAGDYNE